MANVACISRETWEKGRAENKWNCIHGASEGLLRKMNHKWSGRLARERVTGQRNLPILLQAPRPVDDGISVSRVLPLSSWTAPSPPVAFADCVVPSIG